jgi:hypothetical protein
MNAVAIPQAVGDWSLRGVDADQVFASQQLSDTAMTAAVRVTARFDPSFPGWFLYRRVVAGVGLFDRQLEAWAVSAARMLSRMEKHNGREYISAATRGKPGWVAQAGRDGLDFAIYGRYAESLESRADWFGVHHKTYKQIRDPVSACMWVGLDTFRSEIHAEYFRVRRQEKRGC